MDTEHKRFTYLVEVYSGLVDADDIDSACGTPSEVQLFSDAHKLADIFRWQRQRSDLEPVRDFEDRSLYRVALNYPKRV